MSDIQFIEIGEEHLEAVREIYNYFVLNTTVSFHTEPVSLDEIRNNVIHPNPRYNSFVIIQGAEVLGYVLITQHKKKQAYDVSAEVTIYLQPKYLGQGIGKRALVFIESVAKREGLHVLVATLCSENERSRSLFEKNGYFQCAHYKEVGLKFGRRLDILTYQKIIS